MILISHLFISFLMSLNIFIIAILKSLSCVLAKLLFSGPNIVGLLASEGGILSRLLMFVFLFQALGFWSYIWSDSWCKYIYIYIYSCLPVFGCCCPIWVLSILCLLLPNMDPSQKCGSCGGFESQLSMEGMGVPGREPFYRLAGGSAKEWRRVRKKDWGGSGEGAVGNKYEDPGSKPTDWVSRGWRWRWGRRRVSGK